MKQIKKVLAIVLALTTVLALLVAPVSAASYRTNANGAGASSSYQNGKYYRNLQKITLTGDKRTDVIAVALSQLGYQESAVSGNISGESGGSGNYTEFMKHVYGSNEAWAWCAAFCAWSLHQAQATDHVGYNYFYRSHVGQSGYHWCEISCPYWKQALQFDGLYKNSAYKGGSYIPKTGDLIFFTSGNTVGHIGLVVYTDSTYVYTIEGNTSSGTGVEANGGGVYFKKYALNNSRIDGYGALDYPSSSDGNDIDYSGANPTTGLYVTAAYKYLYANESCTTRATYSNGVNVDIPAYTMVEVIGVSADKTALKVTYDGVTGYLHNNSTDRVIQLTSTSGGNTGGDNTGGNTGGVHQLQGVGVPSTIMYKHGIDISYYQVGGSSLAYNMIDFAKLKAAGCEFVILRAGDSALSGYIDPSFIQLYKNAKAAGMDVGVYYFSRATTYAGSQAEAEWLINVMKQNNMQFEYPIYIDIETSAQGSLSASAADQLCLGWCETLEKAGYFPGIYSGTYVMFDKISSAVTDYYDLWIASYATIDAAGPHWDYNTKNMAAQGYTMWQYSCFNLNSSNNYVYTQGIYTSTAQTTPVRDLDLDVCYKDYPTIMKTYGYNGFGATETRPENIVAGRDYTTTGTAGDPYYANLTDGVVGGADTLEGWCGWNSDGTVTFDLGANYNLTGVAVHLMNLADYGIGTAILNVAVSDDGVNYTTYSKTIPVKTDNGAYWAELDIDGIFDGRYVKISFARDSGSWIFMNEIEVYGDKRSTSNLVLNGSYTTSSDGSKHSTDLWQDDEYRLTDGTKNCVDIGESAYAGWQASTVDVIVDLGRVKTTGTYVVYTASGNWGISAMKNVKVSVSTDGKTYTVVDTPAVYKVTGTGNDSVELATFTVSSAKTHDARYVKFTLEGTGSFVWLDEVEVYAKTSGGEICKDNLVSDKDYTIITGDGKPSGNYTANLTDGVALRADKLYDEGTWFGFTGTNTNGNYGAVVFDLGEIYDISGARLYLMNKEAYGIKAPTSVYISVSDDGEKYTVYPVQFTVKSEDGSYWTELTTDGIFAGRYVRISMERTSSWAFINEIEVYGAPRNDGGNLALGGNYTTSTDGSMHENNKYHDDGNRLTDGEKSDGDGNTDSYSGWLANNVEVVVDLGSVKSTGTYVVYAASNFWGINAPENIVVYVSTTGNTFTKIYAPVKTEIVGTGKEVTTSTGEIVNVELVKLTVSAAELADARYVKFAIEADGQFIWIDEVEVLSEVSGSEVTKENLLSGLTHTSTTDTLTGSLSNIADLTDGLAHPYNNGEWFGLRSSSLDATNANTVNDSADFIYDLGGIYDISGARIHLMNTIGSGICVPKSLKLWVSVDGVTYNNFATFTTDSTNNTCYWATIDNASGLIGRYVKITVDMNADKSNGGGGWVMLNEIEVYGEKTELPNGDILGVTYVVDGENVIFTVTTTPYYNRVKVTTADALSSYIKYTSESTVDTQGNTVYTLTVPAIVGTTKYAFDGRLSATGLYESDYYYVDVTVEAPAEDEEIFKSVSYEIDDDKIIFTVVTASGAYNRIKATTADNLSGSLGVGTTYTVDENGNYVWVFKVAAPTATTTYAFDLRSSETMKYIKEYHTIEVEYVDTSIFKSVSYKIENGKIIFTVVTLAGDYNRIKVTTADALSGSLAVSNTYTVDENGNYVWSVKTDAPTETTTFAFDLRTTAMKYIKDYYTVNVEYVDEVIFKSTSYEIKDGRVIFTAVTKAGDYNRVKIAVLDNITSYVKYVDTYTVNADGDYVWTLKFNAPTAVTEYALDIRVASTMKYVKDYYYVTVDPATAEPETVFVSGSGVIADGKLTFTIVTKPTTVNRVKVMLTSDQSTYVKLIDKYTVDANGNYVWTAIVAAPSVTTSYTCDVRSSETGRYMKDYFAFDVVVEEKVEVYKSVSYEIVDGKIVFTVVTAAGNYDRIKVANAETPKTSLGVGSYTVAENGDYVWTVKTTAPATSTSYAFDLRIADEYRYLKDYCIYDVAI